MNQTEKQSIEALAVKLLMEIEQHTTVCIDDLERNIFLQGVNAGYNAALESYKDGWVSELDQLEKWIKEEAEDFRNSPFSEDRSVGCYLSMCVLGKIQELKSPPQTKPI